MVGAVRVKEFGGPEVLLYEQIDVESPGPGQIRVRQHAAGVNYIDTYIRSGHYQASMPPPIIPGHEGAGEIVELGEDITHLSVGDRVAYAVPFGAYAEERLLPADRAIKLPAAISYNQAAAMMLKGMTAEYLLHRTYEVQQGDTILVHAAAGGVGQILCQWGKALGARVIGTVGSEEKGRLAIAQGCDEVIYYRSEDFAARVNEITGGERCSVVYDGIGKETFPASLDCLRPFGMFVSFGNASGYLDPFDINILQSKGSLYASRPSLRTYTAKRADLLSISSNLFDAVASGKIDIPVNNRFALADAATAHREIEARNTTGSTILVIQDETAASVNQL